MSCALWVCAIVAALVVMVTGEHAIDDENPSTEHFCVLDERTGEPINCSADADDEFVQSRISCSGVELGPLGTTYPAHRLPTPPMPDVSLLGFKSNENMFNANVSHDAIRPDQIDWLPHDTVLVYRQYLANYYHIIMDDMIAIWWTLLHHHSPAAVAAGDPPRNLQFLLLDDNVKSGIDIDAMFAVLSNKPILTRADLHNRNKLVCIRRAIVGASERSYGGPGRRFITDALLRQFHHHLRSGAFKSFDEAAGTTTTTTTTPEPSKIRIAMLFRSGQRVVLNEAEVMQGLRDAFPSAEVFEYRPDDMTFEGQVSAMRNSTVLIGVHGAGLTNLMFLPSGASVVEILPWHWERHAYERMSQILGYAYGKWANTDRSATVFPEEQTWKHFPTTSEEDRAAIRNADSKPMNLRGIAGLAAEKYWINQDTRVNVAEFVQVVRKTMQSSPLNAALFVDNSRRDEL